jgi:hypothetical protein
VTFLNPALALGALLFAVPLVIHLLNRQRHKRRPWAAMEFLLKAYQKQRNRLRNENLLLLLLRCLVPIVLALAVARPVLEQAAALLGSGGGVHHVVVVDGSYSMGAAQDGGGSAFDRARNLVGRLLDRCEADAGRGAKVTLVFAGVRPRFLCRGDLDLATANVGPDRFYRNVGKLRRGRYGCQQYHPDQDQRGGSRVRFGNGHGTSRQGRSRCEGNIEIGRAHV